MPTSQTTINRYGPRTSVSPKVRKSMLDYPATCAYCGSDNPTDLDHVIPYSRGGTADLDNLAPACALCNAEKLDRTPQEWQDWRESNGMDWPPPNPMTFVLAFAKGTPDDWRGDWTWTPEQSDVIGGICWERYQQHRSGQFPSTAENRDAFRAEIVDVIA